MGRLFTQLRSAIEASELSRYRISKETGISQGQLSHFMNGEKGLSPDAIERVADCLGLEIVLKSRKRTR